MDLKNFLANIKNAPLAEGREMFFEMCKEEKPSLDELKRIAYLVTWNLNPILGRVIGIEIMSSFLTQSEIPSDTQELFKIFSETRGLLRWVEDYEGLEVLEQIQNEHPTLMILDDSVGIA